MIFTGYLGGLKIRSYPNPIWIARYGPPSQVTGLKIIRDFAPSEKLLHSAHSKLAGSNKIQYEEYKATYSTEQKELFKYNSNLYLDLIKAAFDTDITLLCYCKKPSCHRYLFVQFLDNVSRKYFDRNIYVGEYIALKKKFKVSDVKVDDLFQ